MEVNRQAIEGIQVKVAARKGGTQDPGGRSWRLLGPVPARGRTGGKDCRSTQPKERPE